MEDTLRNRQNYSSVDLIRFIFALLVVTIHCPPFESFNSTFNNFFESFLPRLGVPFFFACSGFFFYKGLIWENEKIAKNEFNRKRFFKYIKRMAILYFVWSFAYFLFRIPLLYVAKELSIFTFFNFLWETLIGVSAFHLWYVFDLILAVIMGYLIFRFIKRKYVFILAAALYLFGVYITVYNSIEIPGFLTTEKMKFISNYAYKNLNSIIATLTRAFPLMCAGVMAVCRKLPKRLDSIFTAVMIILLLAELTYLFFMSNIESVYSYIIITLPLAYFLFCFVADMKIKIKESTSKLFRKMSAFIYFVHVMVIFVFDYFPFYNSLNSTVKYLIVAGISTICAFVVVKLSDKKYFRWLGCLY